MKIITVKKDFKEIIMENVFAQMAIMMIIKAIFAKNAQIFGINLY